MSETAKNNNCKRCGKCCQNGDFWWGSEHPFIQQLYDEFKKRGGLIKESGNCLMLGFDPDGKAYCAIERFHGRKWKPQVCKDYPDKKTKCFNQKNRRRLSLGDKCGEK